MDNENLMEQVPFMKKQYLYLECRSGISGDMTVAALLDLGADQEALLEMLDSVPVSGFEIKIGRCQKCGINACDFDVVLTEEDQVCRHLADIEEIIAATRTSSRVKDLAGKMFQIVAEAESEAHGIPIEHVHFHEVGAVDSIVDILSAAFCLVDLGLEEVIIPSLSEGRGWTWCQHGKLPVPVPAVLNIAAKYGITLEQTEAQGEMITPTGAAIAAAAATGAPLPDRCRIIKTGIGAGKKEFEHANILRAMIIETEVQAERLWMLETNIDDCSAEALGYVAEELMKAGAKDVFFTPVFMKKGRPAYLLSVLTGQRQIEILEQLIFTHTTTIGIRRYSVARTALERREETINTAFGLIKAKRIARPGTVSLIPEYESVKAVCEQYNIGFQSAWDEIRAELHKLTNGDEQR